MILLGAIVVMYTTILATYKPQSKYKNGMLFAVTLPATVIDNADLRAIQAYYNKQLVRTSIWLAVPLVPFVLLYEWFAFQIIYFFIWLPVFIIMMMIPFRRAFRQTLALKRKHEWFVGSKRVIQSDLQVARLKDQRSASPWLFLIPFVMSLGLIVMAGRGDPQDIGLTVGGMFLTILFFLTALGMRKKKAKVYSMNSDINLSLNQTRRRAWSFYFLYMAIIENVHFLLLYLVITNNQVEITGLWVAVSLLFMAIPVGSIFVVNHKINAVEQEVLAQDGKVIYSDDDEYWSNGFTYHNPDDKSIFVTKRVGIGETVNTGTVAGKVIMYGIVAVTAAVIIGVSFMIIRAELTSPAMTITPEQTVKIDYPMYSFDFKLTDIEEITLVEKVPSGVKSNGEATDKYARGHFRLQDLGKTRLYVFKNNPPYIRFKLENTYIFFNEKDSVQTKELFKQLQERMKQ